MQFQMEIVESVRPESVHVLRVGGDLSQLLVALVASLDDADADDLDVEPLHVP